MRIILRALKRSQAISPRGRSPVAGGRVRARRRGFAYLCAPAARGLLAADWEGRVRGQTKSDGWPGGYFRLGRKYSLAWAVLLGLALVFLPPLAAQGQGGFGESDTQSSSGLDSMTVETENPDSMTVGTENPNEMTVGTRSLPVPVDTEKPSAIPGTGVSPDSLTVGTESLSDAPSGSGLYGNAPNPGAAPDLEPASPTSLTEARAMLRRAQTRLQMANTAVGNMMERDYPKGQARLLLYDEKKSAQQQVDQAERWVQQFGGGSAQSVAP